MTHERRSRTAARTPLALSLLALAFVAPLPGCWSSGGRVVQEARLTDAPPISLDVTGGRHIVVLEAPNPGWSLHYDSSDKAPGVTRLFATIRRGDPTLLVPQVIVQKQALTHVSSDEPVVLYARVLDHNEEGEGRAYRRVTAAE